MGDTIIRKTVCSRTVDGSLGFTMPLLIIDHSAEIDDGIVKPSEPSIVEDNTSIYSAQQNDKLLDRTQLCEYSHHVGCTKVTRCARGFLSKSRA